MNKRVISTLLVFVVVALIPVSVVNAYQIEKIMASWLDTPIDVAINQMGMPDEEKTILGYTVLTWHHNKYRSVMNTNVWYCDRFLTINSQKIIIKAESTGNNCPFGAITGQYHDWANWAKYKKIEPDLTRVKHRST
jgi:hypothetical protein